MVSLRLVCSFVIASLVSSCAAAPTAPPETPPPEPPAQDSDNGAPVDDNAIPVDEIMARCDSVRRSPDLPVSCQIDVVDNVVRMQLVMANREAADQYMIPAVAKIGAPFCNVANGKGQPAVLVLALSEERAMKVANCATAQFSDWQQPDGATEKLTSAARACQMLEASSYPIGCGMGVVNDAPALVVSYQRNRLSNADLTAVAQTVGAPFCTAMSSSGIEALVYVIEDDRRAQSFNCATHATSNWISIQRVEQPSRTPLPKAKTGLGATAKVDQLVPVYRTLPP